VRQLKFVHIIKYVKLRVFFPKRIIRLIRTEELCQKVPFYAAYSPRVTSQNASGYYT